ncbi:MAG: PQQ-binding-like beta-propeller repeat protein [Phycisphaerae bacterium]|nr:PQQ-binding-like beta-propeller repeat protein [Phycisphaerae bacterium]
MTRNVKTIITWIVTVVLVTANTAIASDWKRYRGPNGSGISDEKNLPISWSETENIKWKIPLPGPGSSSPIVTDSRVFVTCYSGYGLDQKKPGDINNLKRNLLCIDANTGKIIWEKTVKALMPEDRYRGYISEHGYASNTPVTDGKNIYVFFGKTGVFAFNLEGKQLWQKSVGTQSSNRKWGSAASPVVYKNLVIVNASEESRSIIALDKITGKEVWSFKSDKLELSYATPVLVQLEKERQEMVISLPQEVWAFNPDSGEETWYAVMKFGGNISPSPVEANGVVYVFGGYPSTGGVAIRTGGKGNVTDSNLLWSNKNASYVPSPLVYEGHLYWVSDMGYAFCMEAKTGKVVFKERLDARGGGKPFYASVVLADGKIYAVSRKKGTIVFAAKPQFEQLVHNKLTSDDSDFNASPAISNGKLFLRSNKYLYCIERKSKEKATVESKDVKL